MDSPASKDRILGCLFGGAIGDALGGPYETRTPPFEIDSNAEWVLSDDTQLTMATCDAIVRTGRVDPGEIAAEFVRWFRARRLTGLGSSTLKALRDLDAGAHWGSSGAEGERAAGNGAAMRIAPLAFCLDPIRTSARTTIRDTCRITHRNDEAYTGALAILFAIHDNDPSLLPDTRVREVIEEHAGRGNERSIANTAREIGTSGYVAESVPLAIVAARQVDAIGFEQTMLEIVRAGGDTDTIASMAGQIAGAKLGYKDLPSQLVERLPERDLIETTAHRFADFILGGQRG